jgi:hypothetical protein
MAPCDDSFARDQPNPDRKGGGAISARGPLLFDQQGLLPRTLAVAVELFTYSEQINVHLSFDYRKRRRTDRRQRLAVLDRRETLILEPGLSIKCPLREALRRMNSFQLFTSIKPPTSVDEFSYISDCLDSWRIAGFTAVTVNGPKETEALQRLDLGIEIACLPRDGKPRIGAIFSAIRKSGAKFSGIINSDCKIARYPNLATNLRAGLEGTVVLAWRIDLDADLKPTRRRGLCLHTKTTPKNGTTKASSTLDAACGIRFKLGNDVAICRSRCSRECQPD